MDDVIVIDGGEVFETTESVLTAKQYAEEAKVQADRAEVAGDSVAIWAEGTDEEVTLIGGEHSSKGWSLEAEKQVELAKQEVVKAAAEVESATAQADRSYSEAERAKSFADNIDPEVMASKTVFSINQASKDVSGNPNFMSVSGEQITFNGEVKYTQADGESKEYASVSPIALASGYVMLNNGVASVVPELYIQQNEPKDKWEQPILTTNGVFGSGELTCRSSNEGNQPAWKAFNGVNDIDSSWSTGGNPVSGVTFDYCIREGLDITRNTITNIVRSSGAIYAIKDFSVSRSTDGINWVVEHDLLTNPSGASGASFSFDLNKDLGRYVRYTIINGYETLHYGIGNIEIEAYEKVANQAVWFNPYNNQAKQYNGTDWVDYNGVPVGKIYNGQAINFNHNTYANLLPELFISNTGEQLLDSYVNGFSFYDIYAKNVNGEVKYWCEQGGRIACGANRWTVVSLLVSFSNSDYNSSAITYDYLNTNAYAFGGVGRNNISDFSIANAADGTINFNWATKGYCNKPEEIL